MMLEIMLHQVLFSHASTLAWMQNFAAHREFNSIEKFFFVVTQKMSRKHRKIPRLIKKNYRNAKSMK